MNKNEVYLCKEGSCRKIKLSETLGITDLNDYGLCCFNCEKKKRCTSRCTILDCKRLKVEECEDRKLYYDCLGELIKDKKERLTIAKIDIMNLEKEVSILEGEIHINS